MWLGPATSSSKIAIDAMKNTHDDRLYRYEAGAVVDAEGETVPFKGSNTIPVSVS